MKTKVLQRRQRNLIICSTFICLLLAITSLAYGREFDFNFESSDWSPFYLTARCYNDQMSPQDITITSNYTFHRNFVNKDIKGICENITYNVIDDFYKFESFEVNLFDSTGLLLSSTFFDTPVIDLQTRDPGSYQVIPHFVQAYQIFSLTVNSGSGGSASLNGTFQYQEGSQVSIEAFPDSGHDFFGWDVDGMSYTDNPITIDMTSNHIVTAVFNALPVNVESEIALKLLYLNKQGDDKLTIQSKPKVELPPLSDSQVIEFSIVFKGLGLNGGDLILKSNINAEVLENGQVIQFK